MKAEPLWARSVQQSLRIFAWPCWQVGRRRQLLDIVRMRARTRDSLR